MREKLNNTTIMNETIISELGKEGVFIAGNKYNFIDWVIYNGKKFELGTKVDWYDEKSKRYSGKIKYLILIDNGNIELDFNDKIGRVNVKDLDV